MSDTDTLLLALQHQRAGRHADAVAACRRVLACDADNVSALCLCGLLLIQTGQSAAAIAPLARLLVLQPGHRGARINLCRACHAAGDPDSTLAAVDAALVSGGDDAELWFMRGSALNALHQPEAARDALQRAVVLDPTHAASWLNLGNACVDLDDLRAAEHYVRAGLQRDPHLAEAHASLGFILTTLGRLDEAIAACDAAVALRPDFAQAHWNLAVAALLSGDFTRGFAEYEWRKRHDRFRRDFVDLPGPMWSGDDPAGRTILVHAEQGLGDTIQFARYLPLIAERGGHPVLACERSLIPLLTSMPGVDVVPKDRPLPHYTAWIDQMSLPRIFATQPDTIPAVEGYLRVNPARVAFWREMLPAGFKIGLAWAGNPAHSNDRRRSLPAPALTPLLRTCGAAFVNLQVGARSNEVGLADLSPRLTDYAETAAAITNLDLVVTVDTSVAHVAGALGTPCWVMLPYAPDWRWMRRRDDSPWYRSLRLFRQDRPGDWSNVIARVIVELSLSLRVIHRPIGRPATG